LDCDRASLDAGRYPQLVQRVRSSPLGYFRLINGPFGNEVCRRLGVEIETMPTVSLHGDAHVEQYAITDASRGLTDFDSAASGPPVIDLVRFGTSCALTCRARGWGSATDRVLSEFYRGYRAGLEAPGIRAREPRIVARLRSTMRFEPSTFFAWIDLVMLPVSSATDSAVRASLERYVTAIVKKDPALSREYFRVQRLGQSHLGIGSARVEKYLVRIRGATDSPDDDEILELKEIGDSPAASCVSHMAPRVSVEPIVIQERIAYEPYRLAGHTVIGQKYFWIHAWARGYREFTVTDFQSIDELSEVAFDVGVQLGVGHPRRIAPQFDREFRASILQAVFSREAQLKQVSKSMADEVEAAWVRFCDAPKNPAIQ
jgi:hypothetical protein